MESAVAGPAFAAVGTNPLWLPAVAFLIVVARRILPELPVKAPGPLPALRRRVVSSLLLPSSCCGSIIHPHARCEPTLWSDDIFCQLVSLRSARKASPDRYLTPAEVLTTLDSSHDDSPAHPNRPGMEES